jgi:hypothetical protein
VSAPCCLFPRPRSRSFAPPIFALYHGDLVDAPGAITADVQAGALRRVITLVRPSHHLSSGSWVRRTDAEYKEAFALFDKKGTGAVPRETLGDLLRALGQNPTQAEVAEIVSGAPRDGASTSLPCVLSELRRTLCSRLQDVLDDSQPPRWFQARRDSW